MTVSTFNQPDFTSQDAATYKGAIDSSLAVLARMAGAFAPHAQTTPDMTVRLDAGVIPGLAILPTEVSAQNTGTLTAPVTNPRIDVVYIDPLTGVIGVATGTESATPSPPAVPAGKVAVAKINLVVSQTEIVNADIVDVRNFGFLGLKAPAGLDIGQGLEDDGAGGLRVKLNGTTLDRSASGMRVNPAGVAWATHIANQTQGYVPYYGAGGVPSLLAPGTSGQFLKTLGAGANPAWAAISAVVKQIKIANVVSGSTTSTSFVDLASVSLTTTGGDLLVLWGLNGNHSSVGYLAVRVDSGADYDISGGIGNTQDHLYHGARIITGVSAAAHTVYGRWKVNTGTFSVGSYSPNASLTVIEFSN